MKLRNITLTILGISLSLHAATQARIVGGVTSPDERDWVVSLGLASDTAYSGHRCGATLISSRWAVTAAHCVSETNGSVVPPNSLAIYAGSTDLLGSGRRIGLDAIVRHEAYDASLYDNDIALLYLKEALPFSTVLLPDANASLHSGELLTVLGWGRTQEQSYSIPQTLRETEVPFVSRTSCDDAYASAFGLALTGSMICAGYDAGGKDACQGDSGGPLVHYDTAAQGWKLYGVVSWGIGCAKPMQYGVYTDVARFGAWIHATMLSFFIERLYSVLLHRTADTSGKAYWSMLAHDASAGAVVTGVLASDEFRTISPDDLTFVRQIYRSVLGREADSDGLQYWIGMLKNGTDRGYVVDAVISSDEFAQLSAHLGVTALREYDKVHPAGNAGLLIRAYRTIFGREPDTDGERYWLTRLEDGRVKPSYFMRTLFTSDAYLRRQTSDAQLLLDLYAVRFDRQPTPEEHDYWLSKASLSSRSDFISSFLSVQ